MIFGVDFDGTCVTPNFPNLGVDIGAAPVLKYLQSKGHKVFVWTLRGNKTFHFNGIDLQKPLLQDVFEWELKHDFKFDGYNYFIDNTWTDSPKQFADLYIDDMALGCPIRVYGCKPAVDWIEVVFLFYSKYHILKFEEWKELKNLVNVEVRSNLSNYEKLCI